MSAALADEFIPALAVGLVAMATSRAGARRVPWVDGDHGHAGTLGLVTDKRAQLKERPALHAVPLRPTSRCPLSNARQVFDGNGGSGVFGLPHDALADAMVFVGSKVCLPLSNLAQPAASTLAAALVEIAPALAIALTNRFDAVTRVGFTIGVNGQVDDAQIDPENVGNGERLWRLVLDLDVEVVAAVAAFYQRGACRLPSLECLTLKVSQDGSDTLPTMEQCQCERPVRFTEREDPGIVVDAGRSEDGVGLLGHLQSGEDARDGANDEIGRQAEVPANLVVAEALHLDLVRGPSWRATSAMSLQALAIAVKVASISTTCSGVGSSLHKMVRMPVPIILFYHGKGRLQCREAKILPHA
jgi:hypothetical protein